MRCSLCRGTMDYVHGHAACLDNRCPLYGRNQAECCGGETAGQCPVPTSEIAAVGASADSRAQRVAAVS